jgi:hypothetical protein
MNQVKIAKPTRVRVPAGFKSVNAKLRVMVPSGVRAYGS